MKKIIVIFLLALFIPITKVDGYCNNSDIARLKKVAANINVSYDYVETTDTVTFNITLNNLTNEFYLVDSTTTNTFYYQNSEMTFYNYRNGSTVQFYVYPTNSDCNGQLLYTVRVVLPTYNAYYKSELCKGIEDYSLCQKWSSHNLTSSEFEKRIESYKQSLIEEEEEQPNQENDDSSLLHVLISLLVQYYYVIPIVLIIVCSIGIYRLNKKSDIYN